MNRGVSIIQLSYSEVSWVQFELEVSTLQWTCYTGDLQIEQADLVFYDVVIETGHEVLL